MEPSQSIGQRIKLVWGELSQKAFGQRIGLSQTAVTALENDQSEPRLGTFSSIVEAFNVNPEWLRTGKGQAKGADAAQLPPQVPSESPRINSDRELVRMMSEEDMRISGTSGPPYRMRSITRTPEEEMEYLRLELLRERQAHERTRERYETDRNQNHERETKLIALIGGGSFSDASADAADSNNPEVPMAAWVNPDYEEAAISKPRKVGFKFGSLS